MRFLSPERRAMADIRKLEALVVQYRELLAEAEADLAREKTRLPQVGDFVRSTLTNFYGRVTNVIERASGRPWVEITPYLTEHLPGHSTLDLYDQWEIITAPVAPAAPLTERPFVDITASIAASLRGLQKTDGLVPASGAEPPRP